MKNIKNKIFNLIIILFFTTNINAQVPTVQIPEVFVLEAFKQISKGNLSLIELITKVDGFNEKLATSLLRFVIRSKAKSKDISKACKLLMDHGARYDFSPSNLDDYWEKRPEIINLLSKEMSKNKARTYKYKKNMEPQLIKAAKNCDYDEIKLLIHLGADVNIKDKDGHTPLYYAVYSMKNIGFHIKCIKYLLKYGAKSNFHYFQIDEMYNFEPYSIFMDKLFKRMSFLAKLKYKTWKSMDFIDKNN